MTAATIREVLKYMCMYIDVVITEICTSTSNHINGKYFSYSYGYYLNQFITLYRRDVNYLIEQSRG